MSNKVYAVYSIPKSPEYRLEKIFRTKDGAKRYIECQKFPERFIQALKKGENTFILPLSGIGRTNEIFDIQIEEIFE